MHCLRLCLTLGWLTLATTAVAADDLAPELSLKPCRILGTGRADAALQSINPPDAVAFTPDGLLLATDAKNHRVQIFDPATGGHLGSFGGPDVFPGAIVGIAAAADGKVFVSDEVANQLRVFTRADGDHAQLVLAPPTLFRPGFQCLTGIVCDRRGRLYAIDSLAGEVRRYLPGFVLDPTWRFQSCRPDGRPMLRRADGMVVHEQSRTLFVASEWDGVILAYDLETGRWLGKSIGRQLDPRSARPIGRSVFSRSVEGLAILGDYLLAVDEGSDQKTTNQAGRVLVFQLGDAALFQTDAENCRARMAAGRPAGLIGWWGNFRSPDGVAAFSGGPARPEPLVAVADQGRFRVVLYRGNDLLRTIRSFAVKPMP